MTAIKLLCERLGWNELRTMNYLQDNGLVSDNAVWLKDCAESDLLRAAEKINSEGVHE